MRQSKHKFTKLIVLILAVVCVFSALVAFFVLRQRATVGATDNTTAAPAEDIQSQEPVPEITEPLPVMSAPEIDGDNTDRNSEFMFTDVECQQYQNAFVHTVTLANGGTFSVGEDTTQSDDASAYNIGLILNLHYDPPESEVGHVYGVQILSDATSNGLLMLHRNDIAHLISNTDYEQEGTLGTAPDELLLLGRTWDQQLPLAYMDEQNAGLIWAVDSLNGQKDTSLYIQLCDTSKNAIVSILRLDIGYDTTGRAFYLKRISDNPVLERSVPGSVSAKLEAEDVEQYVSGAAIALLRSGVPIRSNSNSSFSLKREDVLVQELPDLFWCEIIGYDGQIIHRNDLDIEGSLFSATIKQADNSFGSVTLYYDVSYVRDAETGHLAFSQPRPVALGYDLYGVRTWAEFLAYNGYYASDTDDSDSGVNNIRSFDAYWPSWYPQK